MHRGAIGVSLNYSISFSAILNYPMLDPTCVWAPMYLFLMRRGRARASNETFHLHGTLYGRLISELYQNLTSWLGRALRRAGH